MKIIKIITIILTFLPSHSFTNDNIISGKIRTEIYAINNYDSNDSQEEYKEYKSKLKLNLKAKITKKLSLNSVIKTSDMDQYSEDTKRAAAIPNSGTRSFENEGAYLEKLYLKYQYDNLEFSLGKNTLNFGQAWKRSNYIWILNKASKYYRFAEKFAFKTAIMSGNENGNGQYKFTLSSYFNDNKYLENSLITKRDYIDNYTINVGNDKSLFASYSSTLDINYNFGNQEKLSYHFGYVKSAINDRQSNIARSKISDQKSYVANINYQIPITENILSRVFIEYAHLDNYKGNKLKDINLLTKYLMLNLYQNYYLTYIISKVQYQEIGTNGEDEIVDEISLGYQFPKNNILHGLSSYIGYSKDKIDNKITKETTESAILYLKYEKKF
jgi:hypothetical protein